ncbi:MAG: ABC transporter substrate-binding protein [Chloroflexi bacterium]|nr:ABC transporter substrate-binding protein [Chloroflexota bacterium]
MRKLLWLVVSFVMVLTLVLAACGPAAPSTPAAPTAPTAPAAPATPTTPVEEKPQQDAVKLTIEVVPKYGGTLMLSLGEDVIRFDAIQHTTGGPTIDLVNQGLWAGDWTKGHAGGYGTDETDWAAQYDTFDTKVGLLAESVKWTVDTEKNQGTIVYQIRQGIHYFLNPASEASRLVGGREITADDIVFMLKRVTADPKAYIYGSNPELRTANITKTAPWQVAVKLPLEALITGIQRLTDSTQLVPPEVVEKYGGQTNWKLSVGSGPFYVADYVAGSTVILERNPNYWEKDPIGPGKGNQLPYLSRVQYLIIPDASTRQAALRTGKIDQMAGIDWEDAAQLRKTTPALLELEAPDSSWGNIAMRTDMPPFSDVRVRRAMMMATDFRAILQSLFGGRGQFHTYPVRLIKGYEAMYLPLEEAPATVQELYAYNPEKAKQLLKEAGYPNGFKTQALMTTAQVDYYSVIKDMWAKVGVELEFMVRESGTYTSLQTKKEHPPVTRSGNDGCCLDRFFAMPWLAPGSLVNTGMINDPIIIKSQSEQRLVALTDMLKARGMFKEMTKYLLDQAYAIPGVSGYSSIFWWPWLKNYSGETTVGYFDARWPQWVWIDQELKRSMGY